MCGIVGYIGPGPAAQLALEVLQKLECRGYDAAGMASIDGGKIWVKKDVGQLSEVHRKHHLDRLPGSLAIGHVRWATHGSVTPINSHPHLDCKHQIAVVHNGIIENYQELRTRLAANHKFVSETDTEVVCHLIEEGMETGLCLEKALVQAMQQLQGSYALVIASATEPGRIVATAKDSPLVVGLNGNCYFVASDALSFLNYAKEVVFLEEEEIASLTPAGVVFRNSLGERIDRKPQRVDWQWQEVSKDGYGSFLLKEIAEEPQALIRTAHQDEKLVEELASEINRAKQVVITACGSSFHAATVGKYLFSKLSAKIYPVFTASELTHFSQAIDAQSLVIAVSQSGETADVIQGIRRAKAKGAKVLSLVNTPGSLLTRLSDKIFPLNCGPEVSVAATKSFLSQLAAFYMLAFATAGQLEEAVAEVSRISQALEQSFQQDEAKLRKLAKQLKAKDIYYIARGLNTPIADEGALKVKEIAYIHAEGMAAGELKHGTLALIEKGTPVIALCPGDDTYYDMLGNIMEIKARGGWIIGVSDRRNEIYDEWIEVPAVNPLFYPLVLIRPLQLLAYHLAVAAGKDPDKPRHLAKTVTVK